MPVATKGSESSTSKAGGISSEAAWKRTGKDWDAWLRIIDRAGGATLEHKQIATMLRDEHGLSGWWSQMVTVGYEQARKGRKKHEKPRGFEVSASRTIGVPLSRLYKSWSDKRQRKHWLPDGDFTIRTSTKDKSMRVTWIDQETHLDVNFYEKATNKSQIAVQHRKLSSAMAAERMKAHWRERLSELKAYLEA